ncbi:MAG TPA: cobalamin-dependent protein, partial [Immundisolibacter sp.]
MHPQRSPDAEAIPASRPLRFVTAASLFDGHDAAINIMRRLMQDQGAEVIHLGHNRGVQEIVRAALQEDADGISVSSYQGGHVEYFKYMVELLREAGAAHVRVFGGGGGVIVPAEIRELEGYGVERIYSPEDGRTLGLEGMIADMLERTARHRVETLPTRPAGPQEHLAIARCLTAIENLHGEGQAKARLAAVWPKAGAARPPVLGITGPGGAGKSSLTDELLLRFTRHFPQLRVAMLAVDPTRRRTGGALLGDRIRLNALADERIFMRSVATRRSHLATSAVLKDEVDFLADCGFGLILVETAGIGQSDTEIVDLVDLPIYVMTSEYGAATQLEKIDMLDYAELIVLNKFEKRGAEDALRDVRKQWRRNRHAFDAPDAAVPVFPTIASQFNDPGVNWLFVSLCRRLVDKLGLDAARWTPQLDVTQREPRAQALIPGSRSRYLADIAGEGRALRAQLEREAEAASLAQSHYESLESLDDPALPAPLTPYPQSALTDGGDRTLLTLRQRYNAALGELSDESTELLSQWPARRDAVTAEHYSYDVRG